MLAIPYKKLQFSFVRNTYPEWCPVKRFSSESNNFRSDLVHIAITINFYWFVLPMFNSKKIFILVTHLLIRKKLIRKVCLMVEKLTHKYLRKISNTNIKIQVLKSLPLTFLRWEVLQNVFYICISHEKRYIIHRFNIVHK